jgi:vancomycin resistance protein YoaR
MSAISYSTSPSKFNLEQILRILLVGLVLFFLGLSVLFLTFQARYSGRVFPGVESAGVDLSGLTEQEAAAQISASMHFYQTGKIVLQDGSSVWQTTPAQVGFYLDPQTTARNALAVGRTGGLFSRLNDQMSILLAGKSVAPSLVLDQKVAQRYLLTLGDQINRPVIEASLGLNGADVVVNSGQVGRILDVQTSMERLTAAVLTMHDSLVPLSVTETPPVILDATEQANLARQMLSQPLTLTLPDTVEGDPGPWTIDPSTLAKMLSIERVENGGSAEYQVVVSSNALRAYLSELVPTVKRTPQNAHFIFNDDTRQLDLIASAVRGRTLDVEATIRAINDGLAQNKHDIQLVVTTEDPTITDNATAQELGITELVSVQTSYFYGSDAARVKNITTAASRFHGIFVAPGETFSMANILGDITLDNGYAEAIIIYGDQSIKGVGGGVCQVSTTLFRTAFFGGFPIVERHAHAYRVYYYEKVAGNKVDTRLAGLDATVYVPLVDFKFTNDTPYWLLMETYVNPSNSSITWKFYSTSDGRKVEWDTTGPTNTVEPPEPLYKENPDLPKGEIKQVDWASQGADVNVTRSVYRNGNLYFSDNFATHYQAWQAKYEYGPGTEGIPTPEP